MFRVDRYLVSESVSWGQRSVSHHNAQEAVCMQRYMYNMFFYDFRTAFRTYYQQYMAFVHPTEDIYLEWPNYVSRSKDRSEGRLKVTERNYITTPSIGLDGEEQIGQVVRPGKLKAWISYLLPTIETEYWERFQSHLRSTSVCQQKHGKNGSLGIRRREISY